MKDRNYQKNSRNFGFTVRGLPCLTEERGRVEQRGGKPEQRKNSLFSEGAHEVIHRVHVRGNGRHGRVSLKLLPSFRPLLQGRETGVIFKLQIHGRCFTI